MSGQRVVKETARKCLVRFRNGRGGGEARGMWRDVVGRVCFGHGGGRLGMGWHSSSGPL